jgi:phage-related protein
VTPGNNFASFRRPFVLRSAKRSIQAELGERHPSACAMQGLNAVEIVSDYRGATYRGIYTTRFKGFIYVLHCFQKKSKAGIRTPKRDLKSIRRRLADAELHFRAMIEREE